MPCSVAEYKHCACNVYQAMARTTAQQAGSGGSSCGTATDFAVTSREALVSSPGSCPSSRSASAAAAHPGVQQVLNLRALPPWQPLRSFSQHHALLGGGAEVSNLARWRSVITIQPLLYRILSPWCRSPGCTANHGAVLAPSSFILPAKKYGFICRVSAEKRLACHVIAGTQWQRQPGRAGPQKRRTGSRSRRSAATSPAAAPAQAQQPDQARRAAGAAEQP